MNEMEARNALVKLGKSLFDRGYATGSAGNLSVMINDNTIIATPTGSCLGELDADTLSKVDLQGQLISGHKPSKEVRFHLALYQNNPQCKAVVHLHSTYLSALSCLTNLDPHNAIKPFTPYVVMRMGNVPVVPYIRPGDIKIAEALARLAAGHKAFILANHGAVTLGENLRAAADNYEELEETAKLIFILKGQSIRYLTDNEIKELRN